MAWVMVAAMHAPREPLGSRRLCSVTLSPSRLPGLRLSLPLVGNFQNRSWQHGRAGKMAQVQGREQQGLGSLSGSRGTNALLTFGPDLPAPWSTQL